ncbi:bifunctional TH2 protein, mitochondrial isoform X2 [Cryptomeria japonica]|uniref:bifunctional TH2 protein, mitochondrial isoform X2 n=2 Tax=Cryptomeria japonica TaxID=3369 RepID=UPI0027D9FA91|nr:bifunctional TH2 protein, mitochondrial isoform X2 [Cryptomeria japonica]
MYCASLLSDSFSRLKYLRNLINSESSGLVRAGSTRKAFSNKKCLFGSKLRALPLSFGENFAGVAEKPFGSERLLVGSKFGVVCEKSAWRRTVSANLVASPNIEANLRCLRCSFSSAMGVADETGVARRLWSMSKRDSTFALYNPFVVALSAGTLSTESFRNYMSQDAYFLKAFVEAYTMAEECADDDDDKTAISELQKAAKEELKLHNSFAEAWDIELVKECSPNMATVKYTDFLRATAAGKVEGGKGPSRSVTPFEKTKIAAYTVGAMTPCMRLYAFLGQEVLKIVNDECARHPYRQWIETYSSANFEASATQIEELLDKLAISLTGEELEVLGRLYEQALKLEIEFFSAQPLFQRTSVPVLKMGNSANCRFTVVSDFDLSCTIVDSSAVLVEIAIQTTLKAEQSETETLGDRKSAAELRNTWDTLCSQYAEEYEGCLSKSLPSEEENFDFEGLCRSLEKLSQYEVEANSKIVESTVLQGINAEDIKKAGEHLLFQEGCTSFFTQVLSKMDDYNVDMHILSVCWSGDIIRTAFLTNGVNGLHIHSNELMFADSISTGNIDRHVESPMDKLKTFNNILASAHDDSVEYISIYIGDSVGDLLCLLEANIGIVIGKSSNLRRVGKHFGVSFVPLFSGLLKKEGAYEKGLNCWTKQSGILYTVSGWNEIHAFLLGSSI